METAIKDKVTDIKFNLPYFTGSETWYHHDIYQEFLYTDGVQYIAQQCGAYWLLDKIFTCQTCVTPIMNENFIVWELVLNEDGEGAKLFCTDGNNNELYKENILFTDFPLHSIKFYFQNNTLLLPSEY